MGKVVAHGRDFEFDDSVSPAEQQTRIRNWMELHAPDELRSGAAAAGTPQPPPEPPRPPASNEPRSGWGNVKAMLSDPLKFWSEDKPKAMARDTGNTIRTIAQGALPFSDEAIAGVRSALPGGADYDTNLADERARLKEFGDRHGETTKTLFEIGGGLATIPMTMGAGALIQGARSLPYLGAGINALTKYSGGEKLAELALKYPKIATALGVPAVGAASGAVAGFGAGEGGFENRLDNALAMAPVGAALGTAGYGGMKGVQALTHIFGKDNKVADFLRKRLVQDRGAAYDANPNMPRVPGSPTKIDVQDPRFAGLAGDELEEALKKQRDLAHQKTDVMTGDVMPQTMESVLLHPGESTAALRRDLVKRQYNPDLPESVAERTSQYGKVGKWFDRVFGPDVFRRTDEQLAQHIKDEATRNFAPAHAKNIYSPEIEEVLGRVEGLTPGILKNARDWAAFERRGTENRNRAGDLMNYNTQYLHDVKRAIDQAIGEGKGNAIAGNYAFNDVPYLKAKAQLNDAIKNANPEYKLAVEKYGEEAEVLKALREGREGVFGKNPEQIDKGMGAEDIIARLNDPNMTPFQKEMYRTGAARALRSHLLGSEAKKFTHNWADVLANPNVAQKYKALVDPSEAHLWDTMRDQILQLSNQRKTLESALGNSKTATRQQMVEELNQPNVLSELVATGVNPHAPSTWRNWAREWLDQKAAGRTSANVVAELMRGKGEAGNKSNVDEIRRLLTRYQGRNADYSAGKWHGAITAPQISPYHEWDREKQP